MNARPWAYVCSNCDHLATVHRKLGDLWPCRMAECPCDGAQNEWFNSGVNERAARVLHAAELTYLSAEQEQR